MPSIPTPTQQAAQWTAAMMVLDLAKDAQDPFPTAEEQALIRDTASTFNDNVVEEALFRRGLTAMTYLPLRLMGIEHARTWVEQQQHTWPQGSAQVLTEALKATSLAALLAVMNYARAVPVDIELLTHSALLATREFLDQKASWAAEVWHTEGIIAQALATTL